MSELDGFLVGRELRVADWLHRKQKREFTKLCARIRATTHQNAIYEEGGERLDALRERKRRWAAENRDRDATNARDRARRLERYRRDPTVCRCEGCGAEWCLLFRPGGPRPRFCGHSCQERERYRRKIAKGTRRCGRCGERGHNRRRCAA